MITNNNIMNIDTRFKVYMLITSKLCTDYIISPISILMKSVKIDNNIPELVKFFHKGTVVNTVEFIQMLLDNDCTHYLQYMHQCHIHIVSDAHIYPDNYCLVNGSTVGRFKRISGSGCDALFYEEGIGYHSGKPTAEQWMKYSCENLVASTNKELNLQEINPDFIRYYVKRYNDQDAFLDIPDDCKYHFNPRVQKLRDKIREKTRIVGVIGKEIHTAEEWGKVIPDERHYTRQDMIDFANKAIYDYIGSKGLLVDVKLKLSTKWIADNLPQ